MIVTRNRNRLASTSRPIGFNPVRGCGCGGAWNPGFARGSRPGAIHVEALRAWRWDGQEGQRRAREPRGGERAAKVKRQRREGRRDGFLRPGGRISLSCKSANGSDGRAARENSRVFSLTLALSRWERGDIRGPPENLDASFRHDAADETPSPSGRGRG